MITRKKTWLIGLSLLFGIGTAGYAYASQCEPVSEDLEMALLSVTYDGVPQSDAPEYIQVRGTLSAYGNTWFRVEVEQKDGDAYKEVESGSFNAK